MKNCDKFSGKNAQKIVRIMVKASFSDPSWPIFHKLNFLKVADIYKLEITKVMHRVKRHVDKSQFSCFKSISSQHNYNTRHSANKNYLLPAVRTNFGKRAFQFMRPKIWQQVPSEFKSLLFSSFKKRYESYLISFISHKK